MNEDETASHDNLAVETDGLAACRLIDLPRFSDGNGCLSFIEGGNQVPFDIKRLFYLDEVPSHASRGGHALKSCHQFFVAIAGQFEVLLDDGQSQKRWVLNHPRCGLYVPPLIWRVIDHFSPGAICLVLASEKYDPEGYHRSYDDFLAACSARS